MHFKNLGTIIICVEGLLIYQIPIINTMISPNPYY